MAITDSAPAPARRAAFDWRGQRWLSPLALLLVWELASRIGIIPPRVLAAPSAVLATAWGMTTSGELPVNVLVSLIRAAAGLSIGLLIGVALALVAGLSRLGETTVDPLMQIKRAIPTLALTPLFIVWFGIGEAPKVLLITVGVVFPIYLNLFSGIRSVDPKLIEAAQSFGLKGWDLIAQVVLPGAAPGFLTGLRYASGVALLLLVAAEGINASAGLGYLINNARDFLRTDIIVLCLIVYAILGLLADAAVRLLEARLLVWRPSFIKG